MPSVEEVRAELARRKRIEEVRAELDRRYAAEALVREEAMTPVIPAPVLAAPVLAAPVPAQSVARDVEEVIEEEETPLLEYGTGPVSPRATVIPEEEDDPLMFTSPRRQAEQVIEVATLRGREAAEAKSIAVPKKDQPKLQHREIERARIALERERGRVVTGGREEPELVERGGLPMFRPSRIKEIEGEDGYERLIRDTETGDMRPPTSGEELWESLARQTMMSEDEARRRAKVGDPAAAPMGILERRVSGEGVVETAAMASLRSLMSGVSVLLGEGYFRGLGYEVDANGYPVDADDFGREIGKIRQHLGIPATFTGADILEKLPSTLAQSAAPVFGELADRYPKIAASYPSPGVATEGTSREAWTYDPYNTRQASEAESVVDRLAQNLAAGRSLGDEFRDAPALAARYEEVWGNPDAAYWAGLIPELVTPAGPGMALKGAALVGKAAGKVAVPAAADFAMQANRARVMNNVFKAGERAAAAGLDVGRTPLDTSLKLRAALLEVENTPGMGRLAAAAALGRPGRTTDLRVAKKVARMVVEAEGRLSPQAKTAAVKAIDALKSAEVEDINVALKIALEEGDMPAEVVSAVARRLRHNMPDDYVQVTETIAVPRHVAGYKDFPATIRRVADDAVRLRIERQPNSKAKQIRLAANNQWTELIGRDADQFTLHPDTARALNALADKLDAAMDGAPFGVSIRTPKLDKHVERLIKNALSHAGLHKDTKAALTNYRNYRLRDIYDDMPASGQRAAVDEARALKGQYDITNKTNFTDLPPDAKRVLIETLKVNIIQNKVGPMARHTSDMTALQIYVRDVDRAVTDVFRHARTKAQRQAAVLLPGFRLASRRISSVQEKAKLKRLGRGAARLVSEELKTILKTAKGARSVDDGLEQLLRKAAFREAEDGLEVGGSLSMAEQEALDLALQDAASELWKRAIGKLYPNANQEALEKLHMRTRNQAEGPYEWLANLPTVKRLMEFDKVVKNSKDIEKVGEWPTAGRDWSAPEFQKVMVDLIIEGQLKSKLAGESTRLRSLLTDDINYIAQLARDKGEPLAKLLASGEKSESLVDAVQGNIFLTPTKGKVGIQYYGQDTKVEKPLAEGGAELVEFLEAVAPKHRRTLTELAGNAVQYLVGPFRRNAIQAMKYGYVIPNLPFLVYKGIETPFKAAMMTGASTALAGTAKAGSDAARWAMSKIVKRQLYGRGLTAPDGVHYSGEDLLRLAEQEGIGYTAITAERVGSLADDILAEVAMHSGDIGRRAWNAINPAQKSFYIRTAEALERSFRQGAFEARLLAGDTIPEAAGVARHSQFDFDDVPDAVREKLGGFFQGAGTAYKLATEVVVKGLQNPQNLTRYLKFLEEHRQSADPYGLGGDQTLTNWIIGDGDDRDPGAPSFYLPIPASRVITNGVYIAAYAHNAIVDLHKFYKGVKGQDRSDTAVEMMTESGKPIIYTTLGAALPGVLDAYERFDPVDPAGDRVGRPEVSDEKMMWSHALVASMNDPTRSGGEWAQFLRVWEPVGVKPPKNHAVPEMPYYWNSVPPGKPYVFRGYHPHPKTGKNIPLYEVWGLSKRGNVVAAAARAVPAASQLMPLYAGYETGGEDITSEEVEPKALYAEGVIKGDLKSQMMELTLNPTGINFNDPEGAARALAERALAAREVVE